MLLPCSTTFALATLPPLQTSRGHDQARAAGIKIRNLIEERCGCRDYKMFFYLSPYKRSLQTYEGMRCGGGVEGRASTLFTATARLLPAPKGQGTKVCAIEGTMSVSLAFRQNTLSFGNKQ